MGTTNDEIQESSQGRRISENRAQEEGGNPVQRVQADWKT